MSSGFKIKKKLLGGYKICYACPHCDTNLTSPLDDAGNNDSCPQCNRQFVVPGKDERERTRSEEKLAAEAALAAKERPRHSEERRHIEARYRVQPEQTEAQSEPKNRKQIEPPDDWLPDPLVKAKSERPKHTAQAAADTRACPYCGEEILAVAKKCKHCGEFVDKTLRQQQPPTPPQAKTAKSSSTAAGCGCLAVLAIVFIIIVASQNNSERSGSERPGNETSLAGLWTKSNTPGWVRRLDPKVQTAFGGMMNDSSPLYTGIFCDAKSMKLYVNRSEWRQLNSFQAHNQSMLTAVLPHTDNTSIEFIDDSSGETLMAFKPTQSGESIQIVHP